MPPDESWNPDDDFSTDMIGWDGGYLTRTPALADGEFWFSSDGASWERVKLPVPLLPAGMERGRGSAFGSLSWTTDGDQVLVVGEQSYEPCVPGDIGAPCPFSPVSWITSDGRTWQVSPAWDGPDDELVLRPWPVPGGWEALGFEWALPPGSGDRIYRSADGLHWSLSEKLPGTLQGGWSTILSSGTERVIYGTWYDDTSVETPPSVHISRQKGEWTRVPASEFSPSLDDGWVAVGTAPVLGGPPVWVLGGGTGAGEGPAVVWESRDLIDWTGHSLSTGPEPGWSCGVERLAASRFGVIAIAEGCGNLPPDAYGRAAWFSGDGETWEQLPPPLVADVVAGPAGVVGIGEPDGTGLVTVWRLVT